MKRIFVICLINLAPFLIFGQAGIKSPIDLKFNLSKGSVYQSTVEMDINMNQSVMGQDIKIETQNSYTYSFEVLKDSLPWKRIQVKIIKVKMNSDAMGNKMQLDSDNPTKDTTGPSKDMIAVINGMKGSLFQMIVNSNGDIKDVTGFKEMNDRLTKAWPKGGTQYLDENTFKQSMQQIFGGYPNNPIKVGDTWSKTINMKNQGIDIVSQNNYKLESVTGNKLAVSVQSALTSSGDMDAGGMHTDIYMKGKTVGMIHYSIKTGMPIESSTNTNMDMTIKANGMEVPMKMVIKNTVKGGLL